MPGLREPLFLGVDFLNTKKTDRGTPAISVRVNLQHDDLIYVRSVKSRMEVIAYIDPKTGLFVTETEETDPGSVYHKFRMEAVAYARQELLSFLDRLSSLDKETYDKRGYREFTSLANALQNALVDRQALYADLQKQVNLVTSRKLPKVNEFLAFADDTELPYPVTARLPYNRPEHLELSEEDEALVDRFFDVFFDGYNKKTFAWYIGAALDNVPLYDDRVSKLCVIASSHGGSGKSTLVLALVNALFTPAYRDVKDNFDSFFTLSNRFGTSTLSTKRICVYSEASFNGDPLSEDHNFSGLNVSSIKSMVTEGYLSSEQKFGDRQMERLSGFQVVLTNHPPMVTPEDEAMNRRILPILIRPTTMTEKARTLDLWGRHKFDAFLEEHREAFAAYCYREFERDPYAYIEQDYDHTDYLTDISNSQMDLEEEQRAGRTKLSALKTDGFLKFLDGLAKEQHLNLTLLKTDVAEASGGKPNPPLTDHLILKDGNLYLDASKSFLLRYGQASTKVRDALKDFYGVPQKKFHKRMFVIPFTD